MQTLTANVRIVDGAFSSFAGALLPNGDVVFNFVGKTWQVVGPATMPIEPREGAVVMIGEPIRRDSVTGAYL